MKNLKAPLFLALFLLSCTPARADDPGWKVVKVFDGDTIAVSKMDTGVFILRLAYIDAPEKDQPGGQASKKALEGFLSGGYVHWMPVDRDKYGRAVSVIYVGAENINEDMVKNGQAWVYTQYNADPALPAIEAAAKAAGRGLWAEQNPTPPWDWRHAREDRK